MTEATESGKKIRRTRKRVYETVEPAVAPELSAETAEILKAEPAQPALAGNVEAVAQPAEATVDPGAERGAKALTSVRRYILCAAGVGAVPFPLVDMLTMLSLQMLMVRSLAKIYGIPYAEQRSKSAVAGLIGGVNAGLLGGSALKLVPVLGIFSFVAMPTLNAAITYAVGKVFIQHFELGGTFLDFDPKKVRAYFEDQFREGKLTAL